MLKSIGNLLLFLLLNQQPWFTWLFNGKIMLLTFILRFLDDSWVKLMDYPSISSGQNVEIQKMMNKQEPI